MQDTNQGWSPEAIATLATTIGQLWPNVEAEARDNLVNGIMLMARLRKLSEREAYSSLTSIAERGRSTLPSVGTVMHAVDELRVHARNRELPSGQKPARRPTPPWVPVVWVAVFIRCGGPERLAAMSASVRSRIGPWLALVEELGLTFEHDMPGHPDENRVLVSEAMTRAEELYDRAGGWLTADQALALLSGSRRLGGRR